MEACEDTCYIESPECPAEPTQGTCEQPPVACLPTNCPPADGFDIMNTRCNFCSCNSVNCQPFRKVRYVQPPKRESIKPVGSLYTYPEDKIEQNTIYKNSYQCVDANTLRLCRPDAIKPKVHLHPNPEQIAKETITSLSYPRYCSYEKRKPILPKAPKLIEGGPMQSLTTQKHDFVNKYMAPPKLILPKSCMPKLCGSCEKDTIQKLSFATPFPISQSKSCKPVLVYKRPEERMEIDTVNKLSFLPYCIQKKDETPWATRGSFQKPTGPLQTDTTYKLSYIPNCGNYRSEMIVPANSIARAGKSNFEGRTIYSESYLCNQPKSRTLPILPSPQLNLPHSCSPDPGTIYKLSFPIYCEYKRRAPIMPKQPKALVGEGPMQSLTTQKHDYVCKTTDLSKPVKPKDLIPRPTCSIDYRTTQKLSFQPTAHIPTISFKPVRTYKKPEGPVEKDTIQKLSFQPICLLPKDRMPWAEKPKFQTPTIPMEAHTTQMLSYLPPGQIIDDCYCSCQVNVQNSDCENAPRAAIS